VDPQQVKAVQKVGRGGAPDNRRLSIKEARKIATSERALHDLAEWVATADEPSIAR
jgi:hypothetical protein